MDVDTRILLLPLPSGKRVKPVTDTRYSAEKFNDLIEQRMKKIEMPSNVKRFEDLTEEEMKAENLRKR